MLILTRRVNQSIIIGDDISLKVKEIKRHQVRLGTITPRNVSIYRKEIYQKNQETKAKKSTE